MTAKKKYSGALAKPVDIELPRRPNPLISGPGAEEKYRHRFREIDAFMTREREKRWRLLREFHEIPEGCSWEDIAQTLAVYHVPGMRFRQHVRVGAKQKWTMQEYRRLRSLVDAARATSGDLTKALSEVAKAIEWPGAISTLRTRYYESRGTAKQYGNTK